MVKETELNWFERFVILHNELREKRHERKGEKFSGYDVGTGYTIIISIITWFLFSFSVAFYFIIITIILYLMNYVVIEKKKDKR